jgi:hypothetical protein
MEPKGIDRIDYVAWLERELEAWKAISIGLVIVSLGFGALILMMVFAGK